MTHESRPGRHTPEKLPPRERILFQSASIVDANATRSEKHPRGQVFSSDWIDPTYGINYHLEAIREQWTPEEANFDYTFVGYDVFSETTVCDYHYTTLTKRISKKNQKGKYKRCESSEVDELLSMLYTAPAGLTAEEDRDFVAIMHNSDIRDNRLRARLKRLLGGRALPPDIQ